MPSPIQQAGAISDPTKYAPLHTNRFFTGMWTQRNPLRDAATPYLYEKFYSGSRFDSLLDGLNMELTTRLTIKRRPGHSSYNSQTFPYVNRFAEFRVFNGAQETIRVLADTANNVYDATGPNTQVNLFTKSAGAGSTFFQNVGNTMYFGNGVDVRKWVQSAKVWAAASGFNAGDFIVDTNLNLQVAVGVTSANITNVQITGNVVTLTFDSRCPLSFVAGLNVTLAGLTTAVYLNAQTVTILSVGYNQITFAFVHADVGPASDTGTAGTAGGNTGGVQPVWSNVNGAVTQDGAQQWICKGSSIQNWGIAAATDSPTVANALRPSPYPQWAANTYYSPGIYIKDTNNNIQLLTTGGQTGAAQPAVWNNVVGGTTNDNTAVWTCQGPAARISNHAYAVGAVIAVTFTYYITVYSEDPEFCFSPNTRIYTKDGVKKFGDCGEVEYVMTRQGICEARLQVHDYEGPMIDMGDGELVMGNHMMYTHGGFQPARLVFPEPDYKRVHYKGKVYNFAVVTKLEEQRNYALVNGHVAHNIKAGGGGGGVTSTTYPVTVSDFFQCTQAGVSANVAPTWIDGVGVVITDGTVKWTNKGTVQTWANVGANKLVSTASIVVDANGNKQQAQSAGTSGAAAPAWKTVTGQTTTDNTMSWINIGGFSGAGTGAWIYGYAGRNSVTGHVSTASPLSLQITVDANKMIVVQGSGFADPQVDIVELYRTAQGGSDLLYLDQIPNPGAGQTWTYNDTKNDSNLNQLIRAQIANFNDPPNSALTALEYHLGRIFGAVGNTVFFSNVDTTRGVQSESFRPVDNFIFPSRVTRLWSTTIGLLVFTVSDVYIIPGKGTAASPFYATNFLGKLGLLNYDAFTVNGSTAYMMTSAAKVISLDPGAGVVELGFPLGDKFLANYDPSLARLTWHEGDSTDTALYVADGAFGWYRMSQTSAPETGNVWSPFALITGGCSAVQSVEVSPGNCVLLVGPGSITGPILQRNANVYTDGGSTYVCNITIGSIVLAQPGQLADIEFITTETMRVGSQPTLATILNEISETPGNGVDIEPVSFEDLQVTTPDPPLLPASSTIYSDRFSMSQNQTCTYCHHFQLRMSWPAENVPTELLSYTIYGALLNERR